MPVDTFFDSFLDPVPSSEFFASYWERAPLHIPGDASRHAGLFSLADADSVLSNAGGTWASSVRVVRAGAAAPLTSLPGGVAATFQAYRDGATFIFSALQERLPPVRALYTALSSALHGPVNVNAYLTPPDSAGFAMHFDTHDVFVLQTAGTKRWLLHEPPVPLPLKSQEFSKAAYAEHLVSPGEPVLSVTLSAGDILYVPRGFLHAAESGPAASLHLTVGVFPPLVGSVLSAAMQKVIEQDVALRAALPVGFADEIAPCAELLAALARDAVEAIDWVTVAGAISKEASAQRRPSLDGHLLDLERLPSLGLGTPVRRRSDCGWSVAQVGGRLRISFHGKHLYLPTHVEPELTFIGQAGIFTPEDLPGTLDDAGRLVLLRRLVREGALVIDPAGPVDP